MLDSKSNEDPRPPKRRARRTDTWKAAEREIARRLDPDCPEPVERIPVTGRAMGTAADIKHPWYGLEIKHGASIPVFFRRAMLQAEMAVKHSLKRGQDQIPVVVFHPKGARYDDCLVMIKLSDLEKFRSYGRQDIQRHQGPGPADPERPA